jgi:hypothetical protein
MAVLESEESATIEPPLVEFKKAMGLLAISDRALRRELASGNIAAKFRGRKVLFEPSSCADTPPICRAGNRRSERNDRPRQDSRPRRR